MTIAHTEAGTVPWAGHNIVVEAALRERPTAMSTGVADGVAGSVDVEEGHPLVPRVDQLAPPLVPIICETTSVVRLV